MSDHLVPAKKRILAAAADIFGQRGFKDATVRIIAQTARVNVAAINYYFGDKESLYGAVLEEVFHTGFSRFPADMDLIGDASGETRLLSFIRAMFYRLQSHEGWGGFSGRGQLIARELLGPSPAFEDIIDRYLKPHKNLLLSIIIDIIGHDPGPQRLMPCALSIVGQCIYYALASPVILKLSAEHAPTQHNLDNLAEFVWLFSLGGITRIKDESLRSSEETP